MIRRALGLIVLILLVACGGGSSSPTSPSTVTPTPVTTLSIESQWPGVQTGNAIGVAGTDFRAGADPGTIWIAIVGHVNDCYMVRGDLRWDPAVLDWDAWGKPDWFQQGGALVDWTFYPSTGHLSLYLDRPSTVSGASGTGEIIYLRFKPHAGVTQGHSPLQWDDPIFYGKNYAARPLVGGIYGGTVTIVTK